MHKNDIYLYADAVVVGVSEDVGDNEVAVLGVGGGCEDEKVADTSPYFDLI